MAFLYKGQLCKFALHLVDFPRKCILIFKLGAISLLIMLQKGHFTVLETEITTITKLTDTGNKLVVTSGEREPGRGNIG